MVDLDFDVIRTFAGETRLLDEDEFELHRVELDYPARRLLWPVRRPRSSWTVSPLAERRLTGLIAHGWNSGKGPALEDPPRVTHRRSCGQRFQ